GSVAPASERAQANACRDKSRLVRAVTSACESSGTTLGTSAALVGREKGGELHGSQGREFRKARCLGVGAGRASAAGARRHGRCGHWCRAWVDHRRTRRRRRWSVPLSRAGRVRDQVAAESNGRGTPLPHCRGSCRAGSGCSCLLASIDELFGTLFNDSPKRRERTHASATLLVARQR